MLEMGSGFKTPIIFPLHHSENGNYTQSERRYDFPMHSYSTPRSGFENCQFGTTNSPFVSGYVASATKHVYLYKWFLIRAGGNDPENDINHSGVQVALGGYTTSDLLNKEKFTTAPIESRIEKGKLRTVDGLNILLMGAIDEQCTYDNGFPFQVIHLFLNGFPFNWKHVINGYFGQLRLSKSVLSARKAEENVGQQKDEALNSEHVGKQITGVRTGKLSFQEPRENMSNLTSIESSAECSKGRKYGMQPSVLSAGKGEDNTDHQTDRGLNSEGKQEECVEAGKLSCQEPGENISKAEENMLNVTSPRESSAKCSKRGKCKMQPIRPSKRSKYDELNMKCKPGKPPIVDSYKDLNVLRESTSNLSSGFCTASVKKEVKTPQPKFSDVKTYEQAEMDDNLMVTICHTEKDSVKDKKNVSKAVIFQSIKGNSVSKNQIASKVFLDTNKIMDSAQTVNIATISENQTNSHSPGIEYGAKQGLVNKEIQQSPIANVLLEQVENKCTSAEEQTLDIKIPALEVPEIGCKKSELRPKVKLSSKRDERNVRPPLPKAMFYDETTVTECVNINSDVKHVTHLKELIYTRPLDAEHSTFDPKSRLLPNEITGPGTDEKGQCEGNSSIDAVEHGFHLKEDALSGSVDNMPCQVAENHMSNRSLKRERYRNRSKISDSSCEQSKEFVSNQISVMDSMMKTCNDIDATRGRNVLPSLPKGILCDETTVTECVNMNSDVKHATHLEEIICTSPLDAEHSPFDPKSRLLYNEIIGPGTDEKVQCEVNSSVDASELVFHLKEDALSGSADNMPCQIAENHISNRSLKTGKCRNRSKLSDSSCEQSKEFVSNQTTVMDGMMKKCNDIDATCGSNLYSVPCEIQHDITSKQWAEIGTNCLDKNDDKEEGSPHTRRPSTKNNCQTSTNKSHNPKEHLPIPSRRVKTTPKEVSEAFGLKTSRSGRLIVPPLAHWCNQTIAYDLDGSIIAIFDGSSHREENETAFNFKPPQQRDAVRIRQKLCDAANEIIRTPSSVKKIHKD